LCDYLSSGVVACATDGTAETQRTVMKMRKLQTGVKVFTFVKYAHIKIISLRKVRSLHHQTFIYNYIFQTISIEQSRSSETDSSSVSHEFPCHLWGSVGHHCIHRTLWTGLDWTPSWAISMQSTPLHRVSLSFNLRLCLPSYSSLQVPWSHPCLLRVPPHSPWLHHSNVIWWKMQFVKILLCGICKGVGYFNFVSAFQVVTWTCKPYSK
jgi:hypothetical protein